MKCPKCASGRGTTRVLDSRAPAETAKASHATRLLALGRQLFAWWTPFDWRVRVRCCTACGLTWHTIEVSVDDLASAFRDVKEQVYDQTA